MENILDGKENRPNTNKRKKKTNIHKQILIHTYNKACLWYDKRMQNICKNKTIRSLYRPTIKKMICLKKMFGR